MKKLTMLVVMLFMAVSAKAASEEVDGVTWYYETFSDGDKSCARIISGPVKYAGDLTIPVSVGGYPVAEIKSSAFSGCSELTSVKIPSSVTSVGNSAFSGCSGLTSVTIPNGVTNIEDYAFFDCHELRSVTIPTSVMSIGYHAFGGCDDVTSVTIPDRFVAASTRIRGSVFMGAIESITDVTILFAEGRVCDGAFCGCYRLKNVTITEGVTSIGEYAFSDCSGLTSVTIPEGVTNIGAYAFYCCAGLMSVTIPDGVTEIGAYCFSGCAALMSASLPRSIRQIGVACFFNCKNLRDVTMENGVSLISVGMFEGCTSLQKISIPSSVERLDSYAFYGCTGLTTVNQLSEGLSEIGESAFYGCIGLRAMSFPESLGTIGKAAFSGCTSLATVSFPSGVSEVGVGAFAGCSVKSMLFDNPNGEFLDRFSKESLRTLFLGAHADGVTGGLLYDCSVLETIMTAAANPNYCTDGGVLYDKAKTRLIKYPCAVTTARYDAPTSVTDIDEGAFAFASALTELTFGGDVDTIGDSAFDWCLGLRQVTFNGAVNFVGDGAFMVCPSLESLSFKGDSPIWGGNQFWYSTPTVFAEKGTSGWDEAAARVGFVVSYIGSGETSVPKSWIDQYPEFLAAAGGDYEAAANSVGANGVTLRESYIAGLNPTDEKSKFTVNLTIVDGEPVITWSPDLSDDAQPRNYTIYGKSVLSNIEDWQVVTDANKSVMRFFKVAVGMP